MSGWGPHLRTEEAKRNLCEALREAGATIYGWHPDRSDGMSDYWSPASWSGIATYGGFIIAVSASQYDVEHDSGKEDGSDEETFPIFQANPKGYSWHIEKDGEIYAQGKGLNKCAEHGYRSAKTVEEARRRPIEGSKALARKLLSLIDRFNGKQSPALSQKKNITGMEPGLSRAHQPPNPHTIISSHTYSFGRRSHQTRCWYYRIRMIGGDYDSYHDDQHVTAGRYFTKQEAETAMKEHVEKIRREHLITT